jgi:hypothetical protein
MSLRAYVESRGLSRPHKFASRLQAFRRDSEGWFDGTPNSVDRRLAACRALIHEARTMAAEDPVGHLQVMAELDSDRQSLTDLRHDLLTGAIDREARYAGRPDPSPMDSAERRWVTLEASRFHRDQDSARHDVTEMAERARRHAEVYAPSRPAAWAFQAAVAELARRTPAPRTASSRPMFRDHPDELLFL